MRYYEIIQEDVNQTILIDAYKACKKVTDTFINANMESYKEAMSQDERCAKLFLEIESLKKAKDALDDDYRNPEYDRIGTRLSDAMSELLNYTDIEDPDFIKRMVDAYKYQLETGLKQVATDAVEEKYGKIDRFDFEKMYKENPNSWDRDLKKYNLWFLQHILVHINVVKSEDLTPEANEKGTMRDSGGHFNRNGNNNEYQNVAGSEGVDFNNEQTSGITIFVNYEKTWQMLLAEFKVRFEEKLFGEPFSDREFELYIGKIVSTFVHEYVHLLQYINKLNTSGWIGRDLTYIPNGKRAKYFRHNKATDRSERVKSGKRIPDYLGGNWKDITPERYANYFGSSHEIEAHAAGAAADIVKGFLNNQYNHRQYSQSEMNHFIDDALESLKFGYADSVGSLKSYEDHIKAQIKQVDSRIGQGQPLPKADELHRKVWRIFMTKLVKALLQFKKPIKDDY